MKLSDVCMNAGCAVFPEHGRDNQWSGSLTKNADNVRFGRRGVGVSHCCAERSVGVLDTSTVGTPMCGRDQPAGDVYGRLDFLDDRPRGRPPLRPVALTLDSTTRVQSLRTRTTFFSANSRISTL